MLCSSLVSVLGSGALLLLLSLQSFDVQMAANASRFMKCVTVGDGAVGKTCLEKITKGEEEDDRLGLKKITEEKDDRLEKMKEEEGNDNILLDFV
ncbi:hypothetical protein ACH5RR_008880 [Cinchona calisaya]|uniref:Uncharacterized protein n=1 Tax=Cinchona calisaya TaxID=153742 RepID=A0ABD3ADC2_9GENT